jgi:hypothetical protein
MPNDTVFPADLTGKGRNLNIDASGNLGITLLDSSGRAFRLDTVTNSMQVVDYEHHEIHAGSHYYYTDSVELDSAATQVYMITTPDTTKWAHMTFSATGSAITQVLVYEGGDRTGTTAQTIFNSNRNSLNTSGLVIHNDISEGTTDGSLIWQLLSGSSSGHSRTPAAADRSHEKKLKLNTTYLIKIISGTNDNLTNLQLNWYEHTNL